jgi:hypothetical protein
MASVDQEFTRDVRQAARVAARLLDDIAAHLRENLVQRAQYTREVAEQFERLAQVVSCLAAVGGGQPVPVMLRYEQPGSDG